MRRGDARHGRHLSLRCLSALNERRARSGPFRRGSLKQWRTPINREIPEGTVGFREIGDQAVKFSLELTAEEVADEAAKEAADEVAKEAAEEAVKEAYDEAYKEAYDEAYREAYDEAYKEALDEGYDAE